MIISILLIIGLGCWGLWDLIAPPARLDVGDRVVKDVWLPSWARAKSAPSQPQGASQQRQQSQQQQVQQAVQTAASMLNQQNAGDIPHPQTQSVSSTKSDDHSMNATLWAWWWIFSIGILSFCIGLGVLSRMIGLWAGKYDPLQLPTIAEMIWFSIGVIGMGIRYWAQRTLGKYFTYQIGIRKDHKLVIEGPYRMLRIRHPSYLGGFMGMTGCLLMATSLQDDLILWSSSWVVLTVRILVATLAALPIFQLRIPKEEAMLKQEFGEKWKSYIEVASWKVIPFIW